VVTLVSEAMEVLSRAGVEAPHRVLGPLMNASLDNALRMGDAALTGPVSRGDVGTVEDHLAALERVAPDVRATYVALARATALRALDSGRLSPGAAEHLLGVLGAP
jgi:predicted short-subunit dehydrogenase-like oxidoreductase (DUF2520 family)